MIQISIPSEELLENWKIFARGGANVLFKYVGPNLTFKGKLLRMRRNKNDDMNSASSKDVYNFMRELEPEFEDTLLHLELVDLGESFLAAMRSRFDLANDSQALLMDNVLHHNGSTYQLSKHSFIHVFDPHLNDEKVRLVIELKPKWLCHYKNTLYCRNCSMAQMRGEARHFCPLDFVNNPNVPRGVADFLEPLPVSTKLQLEEAGIPLKTLLVDYLCGEHSVFKKLRCLQMIDTTNELADVQLESDVLKELLKAMSLRDVGVFLKLVDRCQAADSLAAESSPSCEVSGRFAFTTVLFDLDPKSRSRYTYWKSTAEKLYYISRHSQPNWPACG